MFSEAAQVQWPPEDWRLRRRKLDRWKETKPTETPCCSWSQHQRQRLLLRTRPRNLLHTPWVSPSEPYRTQPLLPERRTHNTWRRNSRHGLHPQRGLHQVQVCRAPTRQDSWLWNHFVKVRHRSPQSRWSRLDNQAKSPPLVTRRTPNQSALLLLPVRVALCASSKHCVNALGWWWRILYSLLLAFPMGKRESSQETPPCHWESCREDSFVRRNHTRPSTGRGWEDLFKVASAALWI